MIGFWSSKLNLPWLKSVAVTLAGALLFTFIAPPFAQANVWEDRRKAVEQMRRKEESERNAFSVTGVRGSGFGIRQEDKAVTNHKTRNTNPELNLGIDLPKELGSVTESWSGDQTNSDAPLIIHIKDAHGYYAAQRNAAEILKLLSGVRGSGFTNPDQKLLVCIEGAWGDVHPEWLSVFPDKGVKKEVAESLLEKGEITGEEYLEIDQAPGALQIYGIEDRKVYEANLKAKKMVDGRRKDILDQIGSFEEKINREKEKLYPKKLLELMAAARQYESGKVGLKEYLKYLKAVGGEWWVVSGGKGLSHNPQPTTHHPLSSSEFNDKYPNLAILSETMNVSSGFMREVEAERNNLLKLLEGRVSQATLMILAQGSLNYRLGRLNSAKYYDGLVRLAQVNQIPVPKMESYLQSLRKYQVLDPGSVTEEISRLEKEKALKLAGGNPSIEDLVKADFGLRQEKKFWQDGLTPKEWEEYQKSGTRSWALGNGKAKGLTEAQLRFLEQSFYKLAFKRNEIITQNVLDKAKEMGLGQGDKIVLIAGGSHTPGITSLLRQKNVPYAVITPELTLSSELTGVRGQGSGVTVAVPRNPTPGTRPVVSPKTNTPRWLGNISRGWRSLRTRTRQNPSMRSR